MTANVATRLFRCLPLLLLLLLSGTTRANVCLTAMLLARGGQAPVVHGLTAEYFQGKQLGDHRITRIDSRLDTTVVEPPSEINDQAGFSMRWSGRYTAPRTETAKFYATNNGYYYGSADRLVEDTIETWTYVNGTLVAHEFAVDLNDPDYQELPDEWDAENNWQNSVSFVAGQVYDVKIVSRCDRFSQGNYAGGLVNLVVAPSGSVGGFVPQSTLTPAVIPQTVAMPSLTPGPNRVGVSWNTVSNASGYNIYRCTPNGNIDYTVAVNGGTPIAPSGPLSYTDTAPAASTTHAYTVKAVFPNPVTNEGTLASPSPDASFVEGPFVPIVVGDTDHDGLVNFTLDQPGKANWTNARGAIFVANHNRDGNRVTPPPGLLNLPDAVVFNDTGRASNEDLRVDRGDDYNDLAYVYIRGLSKNNVTRSRRVYLRVDNITQARAIHLYQITLEGTPSFFGGLTETRTRIDITDKISDYIDVPIFVEGLFLRGQQITLPDGTQVPFDGRVKITIEVETPPGSGTLVSDTVELRVAPFLLLPNTQSASALYTLSFNPSTSDPNYALRNADFVSGLSSLFGVQATVVQTLADTHVNQWFQDHAEIGYTQLPGQNPTWEIFRTPYFHPGLTTLPTWVNNLLSSTIGTFCLGGLGNPGSGDYGGNIECLFPTTPNPLGRILIGDSSTDNLRDFFRRQEAQPVTILPARWLDVGHIDEEMGVVGTGNKVAFADPMRAYSLMGALSDADQKLAVFFAKSSSTAALPPPPVRPKLRTVQALYPDGWQIKTGQDDRGAAYKYIRFVSGTASGVVGRILAFTSDGIQLDKVWYTGELLVEPGGSDSRGSFFRFHQYGAPSKSITQESPNGWNFSDTLESPVINRYFRPPSVGDEFVLVEDTQFTYPRYGVPYPAIYTVKELLADAQMAHLNKDLVKEQIDQMKANLEADAGAANITWAGVPTLYVGNAGLSPGTNGEFAQGESCFAYNPGLTNFQPGNGGIAFPRQYGPRDANNVDLFESDVLGLFPTAKFIDEWSLYHEGIGEVHCGTAVRRAFFSFGWWSKLP